MKRIWKFIVITAVALSISPAAWAFQNEPDAFNGVKWGVHYDSVRNMFRPARRPNRNGKYYYERNLHSPRWAGIEADVITYMFNADGRFEEAEGRVSSHRDSFDNAVARGVRKWGSPVYGKSGRGHRKVSWFGRDVNIVFVDERPTWRFICTWTGRDSWEGRRPSPDHGGRPHPEVEYRQELRRLDGYGGVSWGDRYYAFGGEFTKPRPKRGSDVYVRRNGTTSFGNARADEVYYTFTSQGLRSVELVFGRRMDYRRVYDACRSLWGAENMSARDLRGTRGARAGWTKRDGSAVLYWDNRTKSATVVLYSNN